MSKKRATVDELCQHADQVQLPAWHNDVLAERERNILVSEASFEEGNNAKKKIRSRLRVRIKSNKSCRQFLTVFV